MRMFLLAPAVLLLAACASPPTETPKLALVCESTAPTGSRLERRVCYTNEDARRANEEAVNFVRSLERVRPPPK